MYARITRAFLYLLCLVPISVSVFAGAAGFPDSSQGTGALGRIEPRSRVIKVSHNAGPEGARVEQLFFAEGDQVKSGDILAVLSDHGKKTAEVEAAGTRIKVLKAQRETERIAFNFNQKEHFRYQSLKQDSMASISLADAKYLAFAQSEANLKQLSAEIAHAEAEQRIAVEALKNTRIHAPISGTVLKILTWPGERIKDDGLVEMADLTQLDIVAEVYESDLNQVKVGQKAYIRAKGFDQVYTAEVRELGYLVRKNDLNDTDPLADRDNRIIEVRLTLDPLAVADLQHQIFRQVHVRIAP
ncbi:MAG: efflux RND transporter periplasmic adaptor subunit [Nitrosomonas sp.]|nr:efflux RND transporter periplasmic adaptor subunit [Nitrosomonas sp.]